MNQTVVVAIDHSLQAENAVRYYLDKMHRPGNKLVLVHGIELPEMSIQNARERHISPGVLASLWKEEEVKCRALENKMKLLLKDRDVSARLRSHVGKPGEVVCHFAVEEKAAFIVIGARGVSALRRAVLGSVSDYILRHALCPVVVCRDPLEIERQRRRHASADATHILSRTNVQRQDSSENLQKVRHKSGESFTRLASGLRRRFASGSGSRGARSVDTPESVSFGFETVTVLYPDPKDQSDDIATSFGSLMKSTGNVPTDS